MQKRTRKQLALVLTGAMAMSMMAGVTSLTGAVQDIFNGECRVSTFDGMPQIVTGEVAAADEVAEGLEAYHAQ